MSMLQNLKKKLIDDDDEAALENVAEDLRIAPESFDSDFDEALSDAGEILSDDFEEDEATGIASGEVSAEAELPEEAALVMAEQAAEASEDAQEAEEATLAAEIPDEPEGPSDEIPKDILAQLAAAEAMASGVERQEAPSVLTALAQAEQQDATDLAQISLFERAAPWIIWVSIGCVAASILYALTTGGASGTAWLMLIGGVAAIAIVLVGGMLTNTFSPLMLTGILLHRVRGKERLAAAQLAGKDILQPLGIAEDILNVDVDARLVTTRDGVVVYANEAYQKIAADAGVSGASGLPPRIERLFGQVGPESRKLFHLCRSAKSGVATEEIMTQMMGTGADGGRLRRFEISIRPMNDQGKHIAWRLREQEVEDVVDTLSTAYKKYPRPVFGLERSGRISWYNEALAEWVGTLNGSLDIGDFILGETNDLVASLWDDENSEPCEARMRRRKGGGLDISLTPFSRGGVGEGFVCIELQPEVLADTANEVAALSGDMSEAPFGVAMIEGDVGSDARIMDANRMFTENFGVEGNTPLMSACFRESVVRDLGSAIKNRSANAALARPVEVRIGEGATAKIMHLHARPVKRRRGSYGKRQTVLYAVDVSFQKRMEEDYSQDQKLKTIGHLAGSIAHDFNNLLLVIMGSGEFLMRRHAAGDPSYPDLVLIQQNAQRAKNLTSNLLAFSRKQTLQSEVLSITEMLRDFSPFLNRSVTERVDLNVINGRGLPMVKADKGQLELAVMNLAVNARDAMPDGGKITIETKHLQAEDIEAYGYTVLDQAEHVLIEVSDNGTGVPPEIADQIFEPFFTTKGEGKGTGLGLSTVYGVIGQMGGRIFLHNRPDEGATFRIFLPAYEMDAEEVAREAASEAGKKVNENADLTGKGRILIVEDEDGARSIIVRALQMCGYEIVEATDGDEALEIIEDEAQPFDLVLSDIMMPEMDGPTLIQEAGERLQGAKVIFMSGYAEAAMRDKLADIDGAGYLQKPFSLKVVAAKVKEALSA